MITHHAQPILDAHNWTNPDDPAGQSRLVERGRGPGTVCVITTNRDGWWNA